jgi:phosphoglucosamine mutase
MLKEKGGVIGGETSGHILCLDRVTTGDALVSALQVLAEVRRTGQTLAQLAAGMQQFPQVLLNVRVARRFDPSQVPAVRNAVAQVEQELGDAGRVVLRPSGTEPVIRVMVEGREEAQTRDCAQRIARAVEQAAV